VVTWKELLEMEKTYLKDLIAAVT